MAVQANKISMKPDRALKHGILIVATAIALAPTLFMILTSVKSQEEYIFNKVGLPKSVVLDHFRTVLFESDFIGWMANSIILAVGAVALSTVVSCLGAYAIARMQFPGRGLLFSISTSLMAIPPVVMIVPLFVLYTQLRLISTYEGAIVIYAGLITPFSVYLLVSFFRTLPRELFEAARIDGDSFFTMFWRIAAPLAWPAMIVTAVFEFKASWTELMKPLIYLNDDSEYTLPRGLKNMLDLFGPSAGGQGDYQIVMAGLVLATIPMIIIFFLGQRFFVEGIATSGRKG